MAILLEEVYLSTAIPMLVFSGVMNAGQGFVNQARILAPRSGYDEIVSAIEEHSTNIDRQKHREGEFGWCAAMEAAVPATGFSCSPRHSKISTTR
ncbi:hypothetical protein [Mycobacterium leprae]|uniref:hypothetical protein n=1 Tax=Mycobacterium leprae TaxID=1769 RepID=UPI0022A9FB2A|nr:hypothetical protein [Mycobacterium leprae]